MQMPRPFTGWITSKGKAFPTQDAAMAQSVEDEMYRHLYDYCRSNMYDHRITPEAAVETILKHFNVSPKVVTE